MNNIMKNPELFSTHFLKILNKKQELQPFIWNNLQKKFYEERTGKDIILKSRQIGFSTLAQALLFHGAITSSQSTITLAHDTATTQALRRLQNRFYDNMPNIDYFNQVVNKPKRDKNNDTVTTYPEMNSTQTTATAGSQNVGRGMTYTMFHGSECAFWTDAEAIVNGAMQGMGRPNIILESSPNGASGYFYQLCMDSLAGRNDWKLHFFPWMMFPEYNNPDWEKKKRDELGRFFDQEYPSDVVSCFLTSNKGYFADIPIDFYTAPDNVVWQAGHRYSAGIDWGQSNDFTCMLVVDRTTRQMVDKLHINKTAWGVQRVEIKRLYNKWRLGSVRAEKNSIGSVNIEELQAEGVNVEPFVTSQSSKAKIFSQLHEELETGLTLQNWDILRSEMNSITSKQTPTGLWTISADGSGHDDCAITLALAISARIETPQTRVWR